MSKLVQLGSNALKASDEINRIEATGYICVSAYWNGGSHMGLFNEVQRVDTAEVEKEVVLEEVEVPTPAVKGKRKTK